MKAVDIYDGLAVLGIVLLSTAIYLAWGIAPTLAFLGIILIVIGLYGARLKAM